MPPVLSRRALRRWWSWMLLLATTALHAAPAHLELDVVLDPASRRLQVTARLATRAALPPLALHPRLSVVRASLDGAPVDLALLRRPLPAHPERERRLVVEYAGTLPAPPAGNRGRGPDPARQYASAEGTYLSPGASWYPDPGVAFSYALRLSLPAGQKGLVPGRLVRQREDGGRWLAEYEQAHPAAGIWLMAGPYQVSERATTVEGGTPVTVRTWFHAELAELAAGYLQDSAAYLQRYSRLIGPYPFGDFSIVSSPLSHGLGMPSLTYLGRDVLRLPFIRGTSLGHEVLHNWWGNGVVPAWDSGNWSEGLTTLLADYAYRADRGPGPAREMRLDWLRDLAAIAPAHETAVAGFTSRQHGISSVIGYSKTAMVFSMLRDEIGAPAFETGLRTLWQEYAFRTAAWDDLAAVFSRAAGRDLSGFFRQWVQRAASPRLSLAPLPGRRALRLVQDGEPFDLLVPLRLRSTGAAAHDVTLRVRERETVVDPAALGVPAATEVELDPELRLWRRLDAATVPPILRDTFIAPRAQLLVAAAAAHWREPAQALAQRLLDAPPSEVDMQALRGSADAPALVVGDGAGVSEVLRLLGLQVPEAVAATPQADARAWTARAVNGRTLLFVVADSLPALVALQRSLPHYGRQSWVVFADGRMAAQGAWPKAAETLTLGR